MDRFATEAGDIVLWEPTGDEGIRLVVSGSQDGEPASAAVTLRPEELTMLAAHLSTYAMERDQKVPEQFKAMLLPMMRMMVQGLEGEP